MEQLSVEVDNLKSRVTKVEQRQDAIEEEFISSRKQRLKLFALADNLQKELHTMREELVAADVEKNSKLDSIQSIVESLQKTDQEHDLQISKTQQLVASMVEKEIKDKGLPSSGKKLYAGAGIAGAITGALGTILWAVLEHIPEIADAVIRIFKELR